MEERLLAGVPDAKEAVEGRAWRRRRYWWACLTQKKLLVGVPDLKKAVSGLVWPKKKKLLIGVPDAKAVVDGRPWRNGSYWQCAWCKRSFWWRVRRKMNNLWVSLTPDRILNYIYPSLRQVPIQARKNGWLGCEPAVRSRTRTWVRMIHINKKIIMIKKDNYQYGRWI